MFYTVADLLLHNARRRPDSIAVIDAGEAVTYAQLAQWARRCGGYLVKRTSPGDRIAFLLPRTAETLAAYFGAHLAALVPVFLHEQLKPRQLGHIIGHSQASLAVAGPRHVTALREVGVPAEAIVDTSALYGPELDQPRPVIGRDLAGLSYTSGSTGAPKGVMQSHDNLVAGAVIVADYLHLSPGDRTMALLPWSFDYGLNQPLATFAAGATVVMQRSPRPADICRTLAVAEVTGLAGVPTLWTAMIGRHSPFLQRRFAHLRYLTNSGGTLPKSVIDAVSAAHPQVDIYAMYGLTEAFRSTYLPPELITTRPESIGKAIPNTEILIADEDGRPCPQGTPGQLVHRGPTVALGYWHDPAATAAVFRPHPHPRPGLPPELVVFTGDYGYADADGYLHYTGRTDEMFKSRGIRVNPTEIEHELTVCELVAAAVVVAVPTTGPDPAILAAVVPRDTCFSIPALEKFCREHLPAHMRPWYITAWEQLPQTPHGKPDRLAVRAELADRFGHQS